MTKDGFDIINRPTTVKFGFKHSQQRKRNEIMKSGNGKMIMLLKTNLNLADSRVDWPFPGQNMGPMADPNLLFTYQNTWGPYYNKGKLRKIIFQKKK